MLDAAIRTVVSGVVQVRVRGGSSAFLLLDRQVTIVDAGAPGSERAILRALRLAGRSPDEVAHILISHYHIDHAGGLAGLRRFVSGKVGVHAVEAPYVRGEAGPVPFGHPLLGRPPHPVSRLLRLPPAPVDTLLHDGDELPVLGGLRVVHTPGHTPGHIALHLPARGLLIAGDALQVRGAGRITPPHRLFTEDWREALRSVRRLAGIDFEVLALSHFPPQRGDTDARLRALAAGVV